MMKINIFTPQLLRDSGGIGNTTYYFCQEFSSKNRVRVFTGNLRNEIIPGVEIYAANSNNVFFRLLENVISFVKVNRKNGPNDSVTLCMSWRYAIVPYIFRKIIKAPYIVLAHGNDVLPRISSKLNELFETTLRKRVLKKAICICANSTYTAGLVKDIYKDTKIEVIHPCSGEQKSECITVDEKAVLSIGRLEERKGVQYTIEAITKLKEKYPNITYYIAGDGTYKNVLESQVARYGVESNCIFLGSVTEEKKRSLLDECSVLAMPSFHNVKKKSVEGFGIVYIEANAHGKPVIGTRSGGIPDAIIEGKTGILVDEKNVDQLTEAIEVIISGKIKIKKADCYEWAEKHYYPNIVKQYSDIFKRIIENSK